MEAEGLTQGFEKAGLELRLRRGEGAFLCRVGLERVRGRPRAWFELRPGSAGNIVRVLDSDTGLRQLVLLVHEPARTIRFNQYDWLARRKTPRTVRVDSDRRKFLIGMDERDLFMAQLPGNVPVTTVRQAHAALNPLGAAGETAVRQGEWFFVAPGAEEAAAVAQAQRCLIRRKYRIGGPGPGKPHTADECLALPFDAPSPSRGGPAVRVTRWFVRGKVRHLDHATVRFSRWHRAVPNAENRGPRTSWID